MRFLRLLRVLFKRIVSFVISLRGSYMLGRDIHGSPPYPAELSESEEPWDPYDVTGASWDFSAVADESRSKPSITPEFPAPAEAVKFTAFWPEHIPLAQWADLLVYLYPPEMIRSVGLDAMRRFYGLAKDHIAQQTAYGQLKRGAEVIIVPEIEDAEINPSSARVSWLEPWHHVDFRFRLLGSTAAPRLGQVSFYVGPLLVGALAMSVEISDAPDPEPVGFSGSAYRKIFVSYSHKDRDIVDQLERAATAIGDTYLRDTTILRSGEEWNAALLARIDEADVFQLCWSEEAKRSTYVDQEWRHAHHLARRNFIRPMYWKEPMPEPPAELAAIHFQYVPSA